MSWLAAGTRALVISRIVYRRWASAAGMRPGLFAAALVTSAAVIGSTLLLVVVNREAARSGVAVDVFLLGMCVAIFFAVWGFGIFGAHASDATFRELALLRVRPTGATTLRIGVSLPPTIVGLLLAAALGPAGILEINRSAGYGWVHACIVLAMLVLSGASLGRLSYWLSGRVNHLLNSPALRLTLAHLFCITWAVASIAIFVWSLRSGGDGMLPVYRVGFLVWPLLLWLTLTASPWAYGITAAVTLALVILASRRRALSTESRATGVIRRNFDPSAPPFPGRLLMLRLWRNPRGREWLLVGAFFSVLSVAAVGYAELEVPVQVDLWAVRMLALLTGLSFGVLVRGLSDRQRPVEARWQIGPAGHVRAAFAAVLVLGFLTTSPVLAALLLDTPTPGRVAIHLATLVMQAAIAVTVGFVLAPAPGSGATEFLCVMAYFAVSFGAGAALERLTDAPLRVGATLLLALAALVASGAAEVNRRNHAIPAASAGVRT